MKKFLLTLFAIGFMALPASATTQVFYNNAGHAVSFNRGMHSGLINNFGMNAPGYAGRRYAGSFARPISGSYARPRSEYIYRNNRDNIMDRTRNRQARMRNYMMPAPARISSQTSRFDRNYQTAAPAPSGRITCGGVTYYGSTNACR